MGKLMIQHAGALASVQDKGRFGYRRYGVPQSGAMDVQAMVQANWLVENEPSFPVIENALHRLSLVAEKPTTVGLTGALAEVTINSNKVKMYQTHKMKPGDILSVSTPMKGVFTYIAIGGQLIAKKDFGSYSTYPLAGLGGLNGTPLKPNDKLIAPHSIPFKKRHIKEPKIPKFSSQQVIRFMTGPEYPHLLTPLENPLFHIDPSSNRIGIRLNGETLMTSKKEILSSAVLPGTIQLPANGKPIILMNDAQTTGGYPRIGKVIDADIGRLAQIRHGQTVRFRQVTPTEASYIKRQQLSTFD